MCITHRHYYNVHHAPPWLQCTSLSAFTAKWHYCERLVWLFSFRFIPAFGCFYSGDNGKFAEHDFIGWTNHFVCARVCAVRTCVMRACVRAKEGNNTTDTKITQLVIILELLVLKSSGTRAQKRNKTKSLIIFKSRWRTGVIIITYSSTGGRTGDIIITYSSTGGRTGDIIITYSSTGGRTGVIIITYSSTGGRTGVIIITYSSTGGRTGVIIITYSSTGGRTGDIIITYSSTGGRTGDIIITYSSTGGRTGVIIITYSSTGGRTGDIIITYSSTGGLSP